MKKYITLIPITLIIMIIIVSCKKSDTSINYSASIKDKTWWGTFAYTDKTTEYYSVSFKADSSLQWSDLSGNYDGKWSINGNRLKMTLTKYGTIITADITEDDKLMNFSSNSDYYEVYSGAPVANPNILLDNKVWKGIVSPDDGPAYTIQMSFTTGSKVEVKLGDAVSTQNTYTRSASGNVIRTVVDGQHVFCVIISDTEMKGSFESSAYPFQAMKQ